MTTFAIMMIPVNELAPMTSPLVLSASGGGVLVDFNWMFLIQFAVFFLLFFLIKPVLLDPFMRVMEEREKRTDGAKARAREMDERAGDIIRRYETELEKVRRVANEERDRLRAEGQKLEVEILGQAMKAVEQVTEQGKAKIDDEARKIRFDLGQGASQLAQEIASKVLGREVSQ